MAADPQTAGVARATGNVADRVQRTRNKLVQLAQEGDDDDRAFAVAELKKLNDTYGGLSRPGEDPGRIQDQSDPNPSPMLTGTTTGGKEKPTFMENLDTAVATTVANPDKILDPRWRRQMIAKYDRGLTGGVLTKIGQQFGDDMDDEALARYAKERPLSAGEQSLAQIGGMLTPGSASRATQGLVERGITNLPGFARGAAAAPRLAGALTGATSAAVAGGVQGGLEAATAPTDGTFLDRLGAGWRGAKAGATDPATIALGAAGGALFGAGAGIRERNPNVRAIEDRGGRVSTFDAGSGGAMDAPLVQSGIDPVANRVTEAGKGRVARSAADQVADTLEGRAASAGGKLRAGMADADLAQPVPVDDLFQQAQELVADPLLTRAVRGRIQREILDDVLNPIADAQQAVGGPKRQLTMPAGEKNRLKMKLDELAAHVPAGKAGTAEPHAARLAHTARQDLGTDISRLNREAATEYQGIEQSREALGIPGGANEPISMAQREGLAGRLGRRGADTRTAGQVDTAALEQALQRYPELRPLVEAPELLQARANLEFVGPSENSVGGLGSWLKGMIGRNVEPAVVRLIAPLLMGAGNATRAAAPAQMTFLENLGEGSRRRMDQR